MLSLFGMVPEHALLDRFRRDLDALVPEQQPVGLAVSGGPDSLALLLLAAAARKGRVEAATVDHGLRAEAHQEAMVVADVCRALEVPHTILTASWNEPPQTAIQERARHKRYRLLSYWVEEQQLGALVTAHHADDQAETFLMRLSRGSGVRGLAAMRRRSITTGSHVRLVRPLLGWRRTELERICRAARLAPADDHTNHDEQFERVRVRHALANADWLDAAAIAKSAEHLAQADAALDWAAKLQWKAAVRERSGVVLFRPEGTPDELIRRIAARAVRLLASEGKSELRGRELDQLLETLRSGAVATIRGVRCDGGSEWRFSQAPPRSSEPGSNQ